MRTKLFERLEKGSLTRRGKVQVDSVFNMPFIKVLDLLDTITADTSHPDEGFQASTHTYCASFGMGGTPDECSGLQCRMNAVDELARFAALYSDKAFIHNFLADHAPSWGHPPEQDSEDFRQDVVDDLQILLHIRPLIEADNIVVFTPPANICAYCYARSLFGSKAEQRLKRALEMLSRDLYEQMPVEFYAKDAEYRAAYLTPRNLFRHQTHLRPFDSLPDPIASRPRLMKQIREGESITLSKKIRQELGFHEDLASEVLTSLRYQMSVADVVGASFLTDREVDLKILSYMSNDAELDKCNLMAAKHLKSIVPFAGDVPISKLLQLRRREEEAFIQFRSALDIALKEMISQRGSFSERDAKALYSGVIAPELARLDRRIDEAKRDLVKTPLASAAGAIAMITFGLYSGMVPAELTQVASVLGLAKVMYDMASKAVELGDTQKSIRPEKFYFLWKAKQLARKPKQRHASI